MVTKKVKVLVLLLAFTCVSSMVFASGQKTTSTVGRDIIDYLVVNGISKDSVPATRPSFYEMEMEKRFGMRLNYEDIPSDQIEEKVMLMIAAGDKIDMFNNCKGFNQRIASEGYLQPIDDIVEKMPNYMTWFSPEQWKAAYDKWSLPDGKLYMLPGAPEFYRNLATSYGHCYKKSAWDELELPMPKTVEELAEQLKVIKQAYPDSLGVTTRSRSLIFAFQFAFRTDEGWYVDYDLTPKGDEITFGPATSKYRDLVSFCRMLYQEELVDPEFPTITGQKWGEGFARGVGYFLSDYPTRGAWAEGFEKEMNPDVEWAVIPYWLASEKYPQGPMMTSTIDFRLYRYTDGMFPVHLEGEKLDRLIEYYDWSCTEEGRLFLEYGVEGVTFEIVPDGSLGFDYGDYFSTVIPNGDPRAFQKEYLDAAGNVLYPKKAIIDPVSGNEYEYIWQIGMIELPHFFTYSEGLVLGYPEYEPGGNQVYNNEVDLFRDEFWNLTWKYTPEETKRKNDIDTVLNDTFMQWNLDFIIGDLDPSRDADWNEYLVALKRAGLDEATALRNTVMRRVVSNLKRPVYSRK